MNKITMFRDENSKVPIKCWIGDMGIEEAARKQLINLSTLPFIYKHLAVMPDVHSGKGSTIGTVIVTKGAIIPAAVGVDLNCGMSAVLTSLTASDLPDNLLNLRLKIEAAVPHGRTNNGSVRDKGAWGELRNDYLDFFKKFMGQLSPIVEKHPKLEKASLRAPYHAGTLGSGNHFIELCLDEGGGVWVMLHSGSRGIGNAIGSYFIEKAKEDMKRWFINLPDTDLSYIPQGSTLFNDYFEALDWTSRYASLNRELMMNAVLKALSEEINKPFTSNLLAVNCHHNYVRWERHFGENVIVTRKGAVDAHEDVLGIIPGSMGAKSFIVRGKGNREAFSSCSHGAGRIMSRTEARKTITLKQHKQDTMGVECEKSESVLDESPKAYKNIDEVMLAQSDNVEIIYTLKQVLCIKG